jgi:hypothetical protein
MKSLIISIVLLFVLGVTPKHAFAETVPGFPHLELADVFYAPLWNDTGLFGAFGGYLGGDSNNQIIDWSIGNTIPHSGSMTDDIVFSTSVGNYGEAANWFERMRITKDGNVGIGTDIPGAKLHVGGTAGVDGIMFPDGTLQTTATFVGSVPQGPQGATGPQGSQGPQGPAGPGDGHSLDAEDGSPVDALFVDNDGNVGIGTTNPEYKLDVAGTIRAQKIIGSTPDEPIRFTDGIKVGTGTIEIDGVQPNNDNNRITFTDAPGRIETDADNLTLNAGTTGEVILNPDSTGNVGIGTDTPNARLHVQGEVLSVVNGVDFFMVPRGGIIMWSGPISDIPTPEWQLCDGTNGTPNLTDRFIVGAGNSYNVNDIGGSDSHGHSGATGSHILTVQEIPSHKHA